jgi:hypothetical protein
LVSHPAELVTPTAGTIAKAATQQHTTHTTCASTKVGGRLARLGRDLGSKGRYRIA